MPMTAPPPKLWVFSTEIARVGTKNGPMSGANIAAIVSRSSGRPDPGPHRQAGDGGVDAELGAGDVGRGLAEHLLPDADQRAHGEHVGQRPGGGEERRLLAQQAGDLLLQRPDRGVLAVDVVADLGLGHGPPHGGGRIG